MEKGLINKHHWREDFFLQVASLIAVIIIFHICYGLETLIPVNINWLMAAKHDWGTHQLGWHFYKNESWQFPIGKVSNYFYPLGTNIGFTDSVPLLAIFFKLFSFILPDDFQYFGIWLFSCHLLTAFYAIRFLKLFKIHHASIFLAVILIAANPVLVYRGLHPALCAHWLLIGSLYLHFLNPSEVKSSKILWHQFILLTISALVNPYLCFMVLGFSIILPVKLYFFDRVIRKKTIFSYLTGTIVSLLLIWYLVGMVSFGKKEDLGIQGGFGLYGMNLNSFYNASGYSRFLPSFKHVSWHQYEGFMYLGIGGILLILTALVTRVIKNAGTSTGNVRHTNYRHLPLLILLFIYALFSITHIITFNDKVLMTVPVPGIIMKLGEVFRASSRFFWVIYYLMLLSSIVLIARSRLKNLIKYSIIIIAVSIQLIDTWPLLTSRNFAYGSYIAPLDSKNWNTLINEFDEIAFYPPFQASNLTAMDYQFFCYLAAKAKKPINTGYVARFDNHTATLYTDSLQRIISEGKLSPRTLYITTVPYLTYFTFPVQSGTSQVNTLDNYYYFFTQSGEHKNILPLVAELNSKNKMAYDTGLNIVGNKNRFEEIPKINSSGIKVINYSIPKLKDEEQYVSAGGWAFADTSKSTKGDSIFLTLNNDNRSYLASTMKFERPDLVSHFNKPDLINAGFNAFVFKDNIEPGSYTLGILIKSTDGKTSYQATENTIKVGQSLYTTAEKLTKTPPQVRMNFGFDKLGTNEQYVMLGGWAALINQGMEDCKINILFKNGDQIYIAYTSPAQRPDITAAISKNKFNLNNSGFNTKILRNSLPTGEYQLGIVIRNNKTGKESMCMTDKKITLK